jgi:putative RNA 2'-phosphotransferase
MGKHRSPQQLDKFFSYILGRRPDEFGLVPDSDGFVKIKELLKAVSEEQSWRYVRRSHIDEILISLPSPSVEVADDRIRATNRGKLPQLLSAENLPKILFTCIRNKAHATVLEKGIYPQGMEHVVLSSSLEMAERIGRRRDPQPVLLRVHTVKSRQQGVEFHQTGESIYIAGIIPTGCFTAPPLPKQKPEHEKSAKPSKPEKDHTPGSFYLHPKPDKSTKNGSKKTKGQKSTSWKQDKKKLRKQKERIWPV